MENHRETRGKPKRYHRKTRKPNGNHWKSIANYRKPCENHNKTIGKPRARCSQQQHQGQDTHCLPGRADLAGLSGLAGLAGAAGLAWWTGLA